MGTTRWKPVVTAAAVGVALVAAVVQYAAPAVVPVLQREPGNWQWWRVVTPLFVQTLGWYQVVTNLVTLALVGVVAERVFGRWRWAVLFAAGTVGGQLAAFAWQEPGGGDSIAICGLAGGVVVRLLAGRPDDAARWEVGVGAGYIAALTGWGFGGIRAAAVAVVVAALVPARVAVLGAAACTVALAAASDLHGVSLVTGMLAAPAITRRAT